MCVFEVVELKCGHREQDIGGCGDRMSQPFVLGSGPGKRESADQGDIYVVIWRATDSSKLLPRIRPRAPVYE